MQDVITFAIDYSVRPREPVETFLRVVCWSRVIWCDVSNIYRVIHVAILIAECAIVSHSSHTIWSRVCILSELTMGIILNQDLVSNVILMGNSLRILCRVVLINSSLLACSNCLPVRMELHVEHGVASKH